MAAHTRVFGVSVAVATLWRASIIAGNGASLGRGEVGATANK